MSKVIAGAFALAVVCAGCVSSANYPLADFGGTGEGHRLTKDPLEQLYWDSGVAQHEGDWVAVVERHADTASQQIVAVLMVQPSGTYDLSVLPVSETASLAASTVEVLPVDALEGRFEGLGLARVRAGDGLFAEPQLESSLRAGWYLALRDKPKAGAGLTRFAKGLASIDGEGVILAQVGELKEGDRLVEVWSRPTPRFDTIRVGLEDTVPDGSALSAALEARLAELGLDASVAPVATREEEWRRPFGPAPLADLTLSRTPDGWVIRANPAAFEVEAQRPGVVFKAPSLLEQALWFPAGSDTSALIDALCGVVALSSPHEVVAPYLIERAVDSGLTVLGDEAAARWRLAELYALAGLQHLAVEHIAARSQGSLSASANGQKYRAAVYQFSESMGTKPDSDAVIGALVSAKRGYVSLNFPAGAAAVALREAEVYFTEQQVDAAIERLQEVAELLAADQQLQWTGDIFAELALGPHRQAKAGLQQEWLRRAEEAYLAGNDAEGARWVSAVIAATSEDTDEVARRLDGSTSRTPETEVYIVLSEANLEALAGRSLQALTTYADALEKAWALDMPAAALLALEHVVSLLEQTSFDASTLPWGGRQVLTMTTPPPTTRMSFAQRLELSRWSAALCKYEAGTLQRCEVMPSLQSTE